MTLDDQHLIMVGGNEGPHTPNVAGTHNKVVHIDATPMNGNATTASPLISVLPARLLYATQNPIVALEVSDTEIVIFGGASYPNTWASFPQTYVPYVQELTLLNHANVVAPQVTGSSSSSGLTGGQIAAIVICVFVFVCLLSIIAYLLYTRRVRDRKSFTTPTKGGGDMEMGVGNGGNGRGHTRLEEEQ